MPTPFDTLSTTLTAAVTTAGTITTAYPAGRSRGDFLFGTEHRLVWNGVVLRPGTDFTLALNAATVVFTLVAAVTIPAGATVFIQLDRAGGMDSSMSGNLRDMSRILSNPRVSIASGALLYWSAGSPLAIDTAGVCASQTPGSIPTTVATALALTINGTRAVASRMTPDVPRNVTVTSAANASTQTIGVVGTDITGAVMVEWIAGPNATTTQGKKAFATVTGAYIWGSGAAVAISLGVGKVLGIPFHLTYTPLVIKELQDGAVPTAGTFVAAVASTPTGTTGDVRGTWTPNATLDGTIALAVLVAVTNFDPGVLHFTGP